MRLIDADVAQQIADKELFLDEAGVVQFVLSHTPTVDAVPVVRCKDWTNVLFVGGKITAGVVTTFAPTAVQRWMVNHAANNA